MSGTKKSVDEIWKELNASKPQLRQGVAGLAVGLSGLPGITSLIRTKPAATPNTHPSCIAPPSSDQPDLSGGPHVASAIGDDVAAYLATLQRTINCLADHDRGLRRSAAMALQTKLFAGDASTPPASSTQLQSLLCGPLLRPIVTTLSDPVERVRAVSLTVLLEALPKLTDVGPMLPELLPELARRFGALPVQEPAEEVRLQITQLLSALLSAAPPPILSRFIPELSAVLCRSLEDGFPDVKKTAATALETAATRLSPCTTALQSEADKLLTSLAPNLQHQHSKVRLAAITALDALVAAGCAPMALVESTVVAALRPVGHDRAQPVREAAFTALAGWMGYRDEGTTSTPGAAPVTEGQTATSSSSAAAEALTPAASSTVGSGQPPAEPGPTHVLGGRGYVPSLLPLLLIGVSDPQPATAELALRLMEGVGRVWTAGGSSTQQQETAAEEAGARGGSAEAAAELGAGLRAEGACGRDEEAMDARVVACRLGPPYSGRPGVGCRAMVRDLLAQHLPPLVKQLSEWTVTLRVAAARGLHTTLVMAEEASGRHLRLLLPALCSAIADDELEVATIVMSCVHVLGAHVDPASWLPRMLDSLAPSVGGGGGAAALSSSAAAAPGGTATAVGNSVDERPTATATTLSASQRTHMLVVLSGLLYAAARARRALQPTLLVRLAGVLADDSMLTAATDHVGVRKQLLAATVNTIEWGGSGCADVALPLHVVLLQLYGSELATATPAAGAAPPPSPMANTDPAPGAEVLSAISKLAACCGLSGSSGGIGSKDADDSAAVTAATLTDRHVDWLIRALFSDIPATTAADSASSPSSSPSPPHQQQQLTWRPRAGEASWQCVLRATLLTSSPATSQRLAPGLVSALRPVVSDRERDPALRLALLQLVDCVLEDGERGPAVARGAGQSLIIDVLMPALVWQAGKTAAAVRYAALTALITLLDKCQPQPDHLLAAMEPTPTTAGPALPPPAAAAAKTATPAGGLLPLLFSALDEDWFTDLRMAACYVVGQLLKVLGPAVSDSSRRAIYPELHKRLDDAHNTVRVAACVALAAFVTGAGKAYCNTNSGYLVAGVVLHMDDSDPAVQEAACSVLLAAAATKPTITAAEVHKVRDRFRAKHYCDRVLAACAAAEEEGAAAASG